MTNHHKTYEELLKELLKELAELKLENGSLKAIYEQNITEHKLSEERIRFQAEFISTEYK